MCAAISNCMLKSVQCGVKSRLFSYFQTAAQPTNLDIIRHWIYVEDSLLEKKYRTTKSNLDLNTIEIVSANLVKFYTKYHLSVELQNIY